MNYRIRWSSPERTVTGDTASILALAHILEAAEIPFVVLDGYGSPVNPRSPGWSYSIVGESRPGPLARLRQLTPEATMRHPQPLRVLIADSDRDTLKFYREQLLASGRDVIGETTSGRELVELAVSHRPDVIVSEVHLAELDGVSACLELAQNQPTPVLIVSDFFPNFMQRATEHHVMAYLVKPVDWPTINCTLEVGVASFRRWKSAIENVAIARQALVDRDTIEAAKKILMRQAGLNEETAYRRLQRISGDTNKKIIEVCKCLVLSDEATMSHGRSSDSHSHSSGRHNGKQAVAS